MNIYDFIEDIFVPVGLIISLLIISISALILAWSFI